MKVALVYDRVNKWGGAERVLLALHELFPNAPLYTAVYDEKRAPWARVFKIKSSFLQYFPFAKTYHELYPWLTPMAFETFNFDQFDVVISVTSAEAKGIITKPKTLHICYCLTPTRYLWSSAKDYESQGVLGYGLRVVSSTLKRWDLISSTRPDHYIAISTRVKNRIKKYYNRDADVVYPPVEITQGVKEKGDYFLVVSRLVRYKRVDLIVEAFNELGWPLVVIGDGLQKKELMQKAQSNIQFIDRHLTDKELAAYYESCRALLHAADEDFGIGAAEALAHGKPVISYGKSGVAEIVDTKTGILFDEQNKHAIISALHAFMKRKFDPELCRKQAQRFSKKRFIKEFKTKVHSLL